MPLTPTSAGIRLTIHAQPRAARSEIAGLHGRALKVRLAAPPVDGAANEALIRLLAERLGVPRGAIRIVAGAGGRSKVVEIAGLTVDEARKRLGLEEWPSPG